MRFPIPVSYTHLDVYKRQKLFISISLLGILFSVNLSAQTDTSGRTEIYHGSHTKMTELKHTKLKVNFDYQKEQMGGEEWLTASPYFYPTDSLSLIHI